ncbi:SDR family oxidoreductase [Metapseudomonas otitidis]|uniref:SDR family oxidoreductase n=1 Tax=Metapseudomonas otitidis TaxID=319939 RepID=UPI0036701884
MSEQTLPPQHQYKQPGREGAMHPLPEYFSERYKAAGKLAGKVALITGGDSGIGRAVAVHFAAEGAQVALVYLDEEDDARETAEAVARQGGQVITRAGDVADGEFCRQVVADVLDTWGRVDVLVNNAGEQHPCEGLEALEEATWERTFRTNILGMFQLTKAALPHMGQGASIINTTSITAYKGNPSLLDYSSTKGPIWTPLIPSTFTAEQVARFGADTPMGRPGQPAEVAPAYVYLASEDASYVSGQVLHVNGGTVVNG